MFLYRVGTREEKLREEQSLRRQNERLDVTVAGKDQWWERKLDLVPGAQSSE